jgi:hypothetical protein
VIKVKPEIQADQDKRIETVSHHPVTVRKDSARGPFFHTSQPGDHWRIHEETGAEISLLIGQRCCRISYYNYLLRGDHHDEEDHRRNDAVGVHGQTSENSRPPVRTVYEDSGGREDDTVVPLSVSYACLEAPALKMNRDKI